MTSRTDSPAHRSGEFAYARAQAELDVLKLRTRAARTVAGQAVSEDDRTRLLSMLGLDDLTARPDDRRPPEPQTVSPRELEFGLAGYVNSVAAELGVPTEATGFESTDTVTAYLGLPDRCSAYPNRDLMLVWNERDGWLVAVETHPMEQAKVIDYLGGHDILPHPRTVATFITHLLGGFRATRCPPNHPRLTAQDLAALLARHRAPFTGPPTPSHWFNRQP